MRVQFEVGRMTPIIAERRGRTSELRGSMGHPPVTSPLLQAKGGGCCKHFRTDGSPTRPDGNYRGYR